MMRRSSRFSPPSHLIATTCLLTCASMLHVSTAHAQDDIEQAKELFKKGEKLYQREDFKGASEAFTRAYELSGRDELLYYMGKSWEAQGDLVRARRYYQLYLNNVPDAENAEKILDTVIELQRRINKEMGRIALTTNLEESEVFVDDEQEARCLTPCTVALTPNTEHTIRVVDPQGRKKSQVFLVGAGDKQDVTLSTEPEITRGVLLVTSDSPSATLRVDQNPYPLGSPVELEAGSHQIMLQHENSRTWQGDVEIEANKTTSMMIPMAHFAEPENQGGINLKRVGAYSLMSAGAGLLIGGALMGRQARSTFSTLEQRQAQGAALDAAMIDQGRTQQRAANVLFITGGLAAAGGAGLLTWDILSRDKGPSPAPSPQTSEPADADSAPEAPEKKSAPKVDTLD